MFLTSHSSHRAVAAGVTAILLLVANVTAAPVAIRSPLQSRQFFGHVPSTAVRIRTFPDEFSIGQCSGVVIDTPTKNIVVTAAHCVYGDAGLVPAAVVEPGFDHDTAPFGEWEMEYAVVPQPYLDARKEQRKLLPLDHAFMVMKPNKEGKNIVDVVGGSRLVADLSPTQEDVIAWGYPADEKYGFKHAVKCHDKSYPDDEQVSTLPCEMTQGSSGGPWFVNMTDLNSGLVYTLGAGGNGPDSDPRLFYGKPFLQGFVDLVDRTPCRSCNTY